MINHSHNVSTDKRINELTFSVENLGKRFNREWIFRDLSYSFSRGTTYAITGPNGSGKSTLLQVLWGQVPQTSGKLLYRIDGTEIPVEEISEHVSIATPYMDLIDEFTLEEHLKFHFKLKKIKPGKSISDLLEIMYLHHSKDKFIGNFSSGMKQRVKLALAFYTKADFLFLDEPGTNLDNHAFEWYQHQLKIVSQERIVFIASNNSAEYPENATIIDLMNYKG